ncbi:hypothetical protein [Legionella fairfieldensis]|nr:hypothetical protein [Legionella fairfieldensis]
MNDKNYMNPQPFAVERANKNCVKNKPSNLAGTEFNKNYAEKIKKVQHRK